MPTLVKVDPVLFVTSIHTFTKFVVSGGTPIRDALSQRETEMPPVCRKIAQFEGGICGSDDPEIIAFLESKEKIYRADDPLASIKLAQDEMAQPKADREAMASQINLGNLSQAIEEYVNKRVQAAKED